MGKLIVIEGLDGSGKATQSALLQEVLSAGDKPVRMVSFPDYGSPSSALVKMYLNGAFGDGAEDVNPYAASAFYAVDRYAGWKTDWGTFLVQEDSILIADRYTTSNAIHQCAKLPREEWGDFLRWMDDFEYNKLGIPRPDCVIYLDVEPAVSQKLLKKRYENAGRPDIHEKDIEYLHRCREAALWCVDHLGWERIACTRDSGMRPIESIAGDVRNNVARCMEVV